MKFLNKKNIITAVFLIALFTVCHIFRQTGLFDNLTAEGLKEYIRSSGIFGPLVYMAMFSVIPAGSIIAIAGGMAFGVYYGTLYTIIGAVAGATVAFYIARLLGRGAVDRFLKGKLNSFEEGMEKRGFLLIFVLRLIPIIPFNVISFGAGLSKIRYIDYMLATMIGIIPGVIAYTNLGDKALDIKSPEFIIAVGILAAMMGVSLLLKKMVSLEELQKKIRGIQ